MKSTPPPQFDWLAATRGKVVEIPIGTITEYSLPEEMKGSTAIAQLNGNYPCEGTWVRNTLVDEWYVMLRGEAEVTIEGQAARKLKAGDWMMMPKGAWYKATFKNAVLEIPTLPVWTYEQCEQK